MSSPLEKMALQCVEKKGWFVFALGEKSKIPDGELAPNGFKSASNDPAQIREWWRKRPNANIGIDLGRSNLTVLDFDKGKPPAELGLDEQFQVNTSRGTHVYFKGVSKQGDMHYGGEHVGEIKSTGGYVLGPSSIHPDGPVYKILTNQPINPLPNDLLDRLRSARKGPVDASLTGAKIPRGQHDTVLFKIGCKLRALGLEERAIGNALIEVCEKRCEGYGSDYQQMCRAKAKQACTYVAGSAIAITNSTLTSPANNDNDVHSGRKPVATILDDATKSSSLLVFKSADECASASELGFHSMLAADFKLPLDAKYHRVVLFGLPEDKIFADIAAIVPGQGAIYAKPPMPPEPFSDDAAGEKAYLEYLNFILETVALAGPNTKKPPMKWTAVEATSENQLSAKDADPIEDGVPVYTVSQIPPFDPSVMQFYDAATQTLKDNIYGEFANLVTKGTTLSPQFAYQIGRVFFGAFITGRVSFDNMSDTNPLRRLVMIGKTGTGKGESYRRSENVITFNGKQRNVVTKILHSIDSGAGLKDTFFEPPFLPVVVYIDEVDTLGHKSSVKRNPDILDTLGELAEGTSVSRVKAKQGRSKEPAAKTRDDAYLSTIMCAPDGLSFCAATAGRKTAGFNDRQIPVYGTRSVPGKLPAIPEDAIALWWEHVQKLLTMVGTKQAPGTVVMPPEVDALIEEFWTTQLPAVKETVRYKRNLQVDAYMNAIGRGSMRVSVEDVEHAIIDCKRELVTRAACFTAEVSDRVGYYFAAMKRLTKQMEADIRAAGPNADVFKYALSERDFHTLTNSYRDNEPEAFERAWKLYRKSYLDELPPQVTRNGRKVVKFIPAPPEDE